MKYILASGSPRRKELLALLGIEYSIQKAYGEEIQIGDTPAEIVENLSKQKALEVADAVKQDFESKASKSQDEDIMIFGADTLVSLEGEILGKPANEQDAFRMLKMLQGTTHQVYTGVTVAVLHQGEVTSFTFSEKTDVTFYPVTGEEIDAYISTKDPMDKAGAYAIQGEWGKHVKGIFGDYNNVVGLPVARLYEECKLRGYIFS